MCGIIVGHPFLCTPTVPRDSAVCDVASSLPGNFALPSAVGVQRVLSLPCGWGLGTRLHALIANVTYMYIHVQSCIMFIIHVHVLSWQDLEYGTELLELWLVTTCFLHLLQQSLPA